MINLLPLLIISMLIINSKGIFSAGPDLLLCILSLLYVKNFYRESEFQESYIKNRIFDRAADHLLNLYDYFAFVVCEMPYEVAKARTDDPDTWILNHLATLPTEQELHWLES